MPCKLWKMKNLGIGLKLLYMGRVANFFSLLIESHEYHIKPAKHMGGEKPIFHWLQFLYFYLFYLNSLWGKNEGPLDSQSQIKQNYKKGFGYLPKVF